MTDTPPSSTYYARPSTTEQSYVSDIVIRAVLEQVVKLSKAEYGYSTFDRELLLVHLAVHHFPYFLEGPCENKYCIRYRQETHWPQSPWDWKITPWQKSNENIQRTKHVLHPAQPSIGRTSHSTTPTPPSSVTSVVVDLDCRYLLPCANRSLISFMGFHIPRAILLHSCWRQSLFGMALQRILRLRSAPVLHAKPQKYITTGVGTFPQHQRRLAHIHVYAVGPLPTSQGHHHLFTVIERSTRWPEVIPMETETPKRFGIPKRITSDKGTTFTSQLWTSLESIVDIISESLGYHSSLNN
ncbi:uncharacterized protein [Palaemon carinicauda]|uniref:uncharacterized protein n=1 Tax=Palaemon carinicauda TaxID=392227 RepID=UPI0035B69AB7